MYEDAKSQDLASNEPDYEEEPDIYDKVDGKEYSSPEEPINSHESNY